jgi:hypothetical protein
MKIITRKEAKQVGLYWYYTGKPCIKGHISKRYTEFANCKQCKSEYDKIRHKRNKQNEQEGSK